MSQAAAVVLAAGRSKRMKSELPKVLHPVCGKTMVEHVLDAARKAGVTRIVVVVGHKAEEVQAALAHYDDVEFALQAEQLGTGHAVMQAESALAGFTGPTLVLTGDTPLLQAESLANLLEAQRTENAACVVGSASTESNFGLGRIVRDHDGNFVRIVEEKDASDAERAITEINTGCFAYDTPLLFSALGAIQPNNAQGELYLTDCAEILRNGGHSVLASCSFTIEEAMGVNTQDQLKEVESVMIARSQQG